RPVDRGPRRPPDTGSTAPDPSAPDRISARPERYRLSSFAAMGDLARDTAIVGTDDGRYAATLSADWSIWGPSGGYVAAIALRAAGEGAALPRPASFVCHFLAVAEFAPVAITVTPLRESKRAASLRVDVE